MGSGTSMTMEPMSDDEIVLHCVQEIKNGIGGYTTATNENNISLPLDYFHGRLPAVSSRVSKDPSSSKFVSMDVMDGVEAITAEIMPSFTSDEIAIYPPSGDNDEDQAAMETALVNYLFFEQYDGHTLLQAMIKNVLLHRNCTAKVYWDEKKEASYETYNNVNALMLSQILQPNKPRQEVEVVEQYVDGEQIDERTSQELGGLVPEDTYSVKIKRTTIVGRPVIEAVPQEQTIVNGDHDSPYLHNARFVAQERVVTESYLVERGVDPDLVKLIPEYSPDGTTTNRSRRTETYSDGSSAVRQVLVRECYPLLDADGDGIAERRKILIGGDTVLLANDEWDAVSLVGGVGILAPHRYEGISLFDRLKEIQDAKTPLVRAIIDGTQLAANPRLGVVTGEVNIDDVLTSRTGGIVRADSVNSMFEVPNPQVPQSSYALIQMLDSQRRERGAGSIDSGAQAQMLSGDTAHGTERIMAAMEQQTAMLAANIGETIVRGIFIRLHAVLREHFEGEVSTKVGGRWVKGAPAEWQERANVKIMLGSSKAERSRQAAAMQGVLEIQRELAANGSIMFDESKAYTAIIDAIKLSGITTPDRYLVDPKSPEGQQASQAKQQEAQKQEMIQLQSMMETIQAQKELAKAETMKGQAQIMSQAIKAENETLKRQLEEANAMVRAADLSDKTQFNYDKLEADLAMRLTELEVEQNKELNRQYIQNGGRV